MSTEYEIAVGILKIASEQENGIATFDMLRDQIPSYVNLDEQDLRESDTRHGEPMWHQIVRNVQSHHEQEDNFIARGLLTHLPKTGYEITSLGLDFLSAR